MWAVSYILLKYKILIIVVLCGNLETGLETGVAIGLSAATGVQNVGNQTSLTICRVFISGREQRIVREKEKVTVRFYCCSGGLATSFKDVLIS